MPAARVSAADRRIGSAAVLPTSVKQTCLACFALLAGRWRMQLLGLGALNAFFFCSLRLTTAVFMTSVPSEPRP